MALDLNPTKGNNMVMNKRSVHFIECFIFGYTVILYDMVIVSDRKGKGYNSDCEDGPHGSAKNFSRNLARASIIGRLPEG